MTLVFLYFRGDEEDTGMEGGTSPLPVNRVGKKNNNLKKEKRGQREKKHKFAIEDIRNEVPREQLQRKKHNLPKKEGGAQQKLLIIPGGLWYDLVSK